MKIVVYGNADKDRTTGFPTEADFVEYIEDGIKSKFDNRYQFSQRHDADIILLSREGKAYGYFVISSMENPRPEDFFIAKNPRRVYIVEKSVSFQNPVRLKEMGIVRYQFGKSISGEQFDEIKKLGGCK